MLSRKILQKLREWAGEEGRKPLILRGARQVGKTTAVDIFSKDFDLYIPLNLEKREDADFFERKLPVEKLIQAIFLSRNIPFSKNKKILLFIDEIQTSPPALAMMRFFFESESSFPNLYVVAAGSLLEAVISKHQISFPVGRVRYLFMFPLTFEEFLMACGEDEALKLYQQVPLPDYAFAKLLKLFHQYALIGGMPEAVNKFLNKEDLVALTPVFQGLLTSYMDDIRKYARNQTMVEIIRHAIEAAPFEAGNRIKFQGFGQSNYKSREMGEALKILQRVMLIYLLYPSVTTELPIISDYKKSPRLQFLDTGLLNFIVGLQGEFFKFEDLHSIYRGALAEHIVGQELLGLDNERPQRITFWVREQKQSNAEVDFIIPFKQYVIPLEVKAGKSGALRSLQQFINRAPHPYALRLYAGPLQETKVSSPTVKPFRLLNLPYFLAGKVYEYLPLFIEGRTPFTTS